MTQLPRPQPDCHGTGKKPRPDQDREAQHSEVVVRLSQLELEARLRTRMGGTSEELAQLEEAAKTGKAKLWAALRKARGE